MEIDVKLMTNCGFAVAVFVHKDEPLYGLACQESARSSSRIFLAFYPYFGLELPTSAVRSQQFA